MKDILSRKNLMYAAAVAGGLWIHQKVVERIIEKEAKKQQQPAQGVAADLRRGYDNITGVGRD